VSIWLVRHAQTTQSGVCYGQSDVPVHPGAADAARLIVQQWQQAGQDDPPELWTSPWARAQSVAAELARHWRVSCNVDARLSELCFGVWEGREYAEIERNDAARWHHWLQNYELAAPPKGETVPQLRARVASWLDERKSATSSVLAVTHAGVVRTARALIGQLPYSAFVGSAVPYLQLELVFRAESCGSEPLSGDRIV
jgi:broad specificity phosphatase PhoE